MGNGQHNRIEVVLCYEIVREPRIRPDNQESVRKPKSGPGIGQIQRESRRRHLVKSKRHTGAKFFKKILKNSKKKRTSDTRTTITVRDEGDKSRNSRSRISVCSSTLGQMFLSSKS